MHTAIEKERIEMRKELHISVVGAAVLKARHPVTERVVT
jgi:hypothetical protein